MEPFYRLTSNTKALSGALAVLALLLFIPFGTHIIQQRFSTTPSADVRTEAPETSIGLRQHIYNCTVGDPSNGIPAQPNCNQIGVGKTVAVDVVVRTDVDAANLVNVQLTFPSAILSVEKIVIKGSTDATASSGDQPVEAKDFFITSWVNHKYDNDLGTVQILGAVPTPGFITKSGNVAPVMARVFVKVEAAGSATIMVEDKSAIYRNADNVNILNKKTNFGFQVK